MHDRATVRLPFFNLLGGDDDRLAPMENKMAKRWVKQRLKRLFPELRNDPEGLDRAYRQLGIESLPGAGKGGTVVYEITLPERKMPGGAGAD